MASNRKSTKYEDNKGQQTGHMETNTREAKIYLDDDDDKVFVLRYHHLHHHLARMFITGTRRGGRNVTAHTICAHSTRLTS